MSILSKVLGAEGIDKKVEEVADSVGQAAQQEEPSEVPVPAEEPHVENPAAGATDAPADSPAEPKVDPVVKDEAEKKPEKREKTMICDHASRAFGSTHFAEFVGRNVIDFANTMDIVDERKRRGAVISLNLGEGGVERRLNLCLNFLSLEKEYGKVCGSPEMVLEAETYLKKLSDFKKWIGA